MVIKERSQTSLSCKPDRPKNMISKLNPIHYKKLFYLDSLLLLYLLWNFSMNLFAFLNRVLSTIGCSFPLALLLGDPITFLLGNFGTTLERLVFTFLI